MIHNELKSADFNKIWPVLTSNTTETSGEAGLLAVKLYCDYTGLTSKNYNNSKIYRDIQNDPRVQEVDRAYMKYNPGATRDTLSFKRYKYGEYFFNEWKKRNPSA